jgi:hypothetical protein
LSALLLADLLPWCFWSRQLHAQIGGEEGRGFLHDEERLWLKSIRSSFTIDIFGARRGNSMSL